MFLSLKFPIIGLCNSSANFSLEMVSFLIVPPEFFLSKNLLTPEETPHWYPSYVRFLAILNAWSRNILSSAVNF